MTSDHYYKQLFQLMDSLQFSGKTAEAMDQQTAVDLCLEHFKSHYGRKEKIIVVGNGGSAAIASHTAIDYMKNGRFQTVCFNEGALLTCYGNDFGYENVFYEPILQIANPGDTLIAISSSGKSPNILNAVKAAREKGCFVMTLSGFAEDNPLRKTGDINLYTASNQYGYVELSHQIFLHMVLDRILEGQNAQ